VIAWPARYEVGGVDALAESDAFEPAAGDRRAGDHRLDAELAARGVRGDHWSSRLLVGHLTKAGTPVSSAEIARI